MATRRKSVKRRTTRLRGDAQRNRDGLLAAAVDAFARDPAASLEGIARAAGVGIGTLYRHYPTRDALVEAVFRTEIEALCAVAPKLHAKHPADMALSRFLDMLIDRVLSNPGMVQAIRAVIAPGGTSMSESRAMLAAALEPIVEAGRADGLLRADITVDDFLAAKVAVIAARPEYARRLATILLDGLRSPGSSRARAPVKRQKKGRTP
ncbi:helix-turn-helix domain-containing protein [Sorangium sp. So ce134]